jgi:hypothetical protein
MPNRILLIFTLCFSVAVSFGQTNLLPDTVRLTVRNFAPGAITNYRSDPQFQYERVTEPPTSLWNRFWAWFWNKVGEIFSTGKGRQTLNTILTLLASAIIVYFIIKLTGMSNTGLFGKPNKAHPFGYAVTEEDIHSINFDVEIEEAVKQANYRLAVRLFYLQSLKNLADRELIQWKIDKTNVAYVQELSGSKYHQVFRNLTEKFENTWYGDLPINEREFGRVREEFVLFNRQMK